MSDYSPVSGFNWQDLAQIEQTPTYTDFSQMSYAPGEGSFYDLAGVDPGYDYYGFTDAVSPSSYFQEPGLLDSISNSLGNLSAKDWASLGLGGLSLAGNFYENRQNRNLAKNQQKFAEQQLASGENADIAKTAALLNLIQNRQGIATSPESYEAVRRGSPLADIANRPIIDVGGRMGPAVANPQVKAATGGHIGALRLVQGGTGGQDDSVNARLSDGEYVFDADVVAALGDGNTQAGAAKLDRMRENIRAHKRSASSKSIPPKAKAPEQYLRGGKK